MQIESDLRSPTRSSKLEHLSTLTRCTYRYIPHAPERFGHISASATYYQHTPRHSQHSLSFCRTHKLLPACQIWLGDHAYSSHCGMLAFVLHRFRHTIASRALLTSSPVEALPLLRRLSSPVAGRRCLPVSRGRPSRQLPPNASRY